MPRKSAVAIATLEPRGRRLEPPPGLSEAERAAFVATVRSVKPGHFAAEDVPLLTAYCCRHRARARHRPGARGGRGEEEGEGPPLDRARARCGKPDAGWREPYAWGRWRGPRAAIAACRARSSRAAPCRGNTGRVKARPIDPRRAEYCAGARLICICRKDVSSAGRSRCPPSCGMISGRFTITHMATRRAIISRGRKNAKTCECAFILLLHLCGPEHRINSQMFSCAQSRDQAAVLFSPGGQDRAPVAEASAGNPDPGYCQGAALPGARDLLQGA